MPQENKQLLEELLTGPAQFLVWLYERQRDRGQTEVTLGLARRELGSKVYTHAYKLALLGLVEITGNKAVILTDQGRKIAECLLKCL